MAREREVKLRILERAGFQRILDALPDRGRRAQTNIYFDTPEWDLSRRGRSVRVRLEEGRAVLTVKRGASISAGAIESEEIETELPRDVWGEIEAGRAGIESASTLSAGLAGALEGWRVAEVGRLSNTRHLREGPGGALYELDETQFPSGDVHYELEIETEDTARELTQARALLDNLGIAYDEAVTTKHERLYRDLRRAR